MKLYPQSKLRKSTISAQDTKLFRKRYKVIDWSKYLINLPYLLLVLKIQWSIEVRNFLIGALQNQIIFTWVHKVAQFYNANTKHYYYLSQTW